MRRYIRHSEGLLLKKEGPLFDELVGQVLRKLPARQSDWL